MTARIRRLPWSPRSWRQALYLAGAIPAQLVAVVVVLTCDPRVIWHIHSVTVQHHSFRLLWPAHYGSLWPLWAVGLMIVFLAVPLLTRMQRHRLHITAGMDIARQPARSGIVAAARSRATWRQLGYHLLAGPALAAAAIAAVGCWVAGLLCTLVYSYAVAMPPGYAVRNEMSRSPSFGRWIAIPGDVYLTVAGIALLVAAPWLTAGVAALDAIAARSLLGASRAEELEQRVEQLAQARTGAVDAADTERRRLERDLHDGTQQRLVALAMHLGMAKAGTTTVEEAHQAISEAHEDTKAALAELRHLVRGLHPPVLEDRGLDAALSGIAARVPIPVRLSVDVSRRPPAMIEAVAYFVVSEGLTNITKHAQASQAEVVVQRAGDRLHVIISDDGVGGADPAHGTGLTGLAKRAASVDGTFEIASPPGGPTLVTVDLPCVR